MSEPKRITIAAVCATYMEHVVPKDAHAVQVSQTRQAFYAGAISIIELLKHIGKPSVTEDTAVVILERLSREADAFMAEMKATKH